MPVFYNVSDSYRLLIMPPSVKNEFTDIAYATKSATQKFDIYLPNEGEAPFPVIITFHGGRFTAGSKGRYVQFRCFRA